MKKCIKCLKEKSLDNFYKGKTCKDGRVNQCKECKRLMNQKKYRTKEYKEWRIGYEAKRVHSEKRKLQRKSSWDREFRLHHDKILARLAVARAVRKGVLVKNPCEDCGATRAHAHHTDYSKRLDVQWFCPEHHKQQHVIKPFFIK